MRLNHCRYKGIYRYIMKNLEKPVKKIGYDERTAFSQYDLEIILIEFEEYKKFVQKMKNKQNMNLLILRNQIYERCNKDVLGYFMSFVNYPLTTIEKVLIKKKEMYEKIALLLAKKANIILKGWRGFKWKKTDEENIIQYFRTRILNEVDFLKIRKNIIQMHKLIKERDEEREYNEHYCHGCSESYERCRCNEEEEECDYCANPVSYCHCRSGMREREEEEERRHRRRRGYSSDSSHSY
jgi:hypothetical protein